MLERLRNNNVRVIQKPLIDLDDFIKYTDNYINSLLILNYVKNKVFKIGNKLFISEKQAIDILRNYKTKKGITILEEMHKKKEINDIELAKLYKSNSLKQMNISTNTDIDQYKCSILSPNINDYNDKNVYLISIIGIYTQRINQECANQMLVGFGYTNDIVKYNNQLKSIYGKYYDINQIYTIKNASYADFLIKRNIKKKKLNTDFLINGMKRDDVVLLDNNFNYFKFLEIINECIIESEKTELFSDIDIEENNDYHAGYKDGYQKGYQDCQQKIKNKK
jgi:hypothetical protein